MAPPCVLLLLCAAVAAHSTHSTPSAHFQLKVFNMKATGLPKEWFRGNSDGYVKVFVQSNLLGETSVRHGNRDPWWEEAFTVQVQEDVTLKLEVHDKDLISNDDLLGTCQTQVKIGTLQKGCVSYHQEECTLKTKGKLLYTYSLE